MPLRRLVLAVVVPCAIAVAACGGGDKADAVLGRSRSIRE